MTMERIRMMTIALALALAVGACGDEDETNNGNGSTNGATNVATNGMTNGVTNGATNGPTNGMTNGMTNGDMPLDPETAPRASVDRFSEAAGTLMVRTVENGLPEADEPIDYDSGEPFMTQGLGPDGEVVQYYNFDVQPTEPAPIFVLFREGEDAPVEGQLNVIGVIPGDDGYNDFWHPHRVTVPVDYVANTLTSVEEIEASGYAIEPLDAIVNCPVVPEGSTATKRVGGGDAGLVMGWYDDQVVYYFEFAEGMLMTDPDDPTVPLSPIYVAFNLNPDEMNPDSGPASGFMTEEGTAQTHNVLATLPGDDGYSPLWSVNVYDNADFDEVSDFDSATGANILATGVANVNCPVVSIE
jgi:hypothetical protein